MHPTARSVLRIVALRILGTLRRTPLVMCCLMLPLAVTSASRSVAAQQAPIVTISPGSQMLYVDQVFVTITWCVTWGSEWFNPDTREIKLSGNNVAHLFTHDEVGWNQHPECMQYERSTGTIPTTQTSQTLSALVYSYINWLGAESVVYTRPAPTAGVQVTAAASLLEREAGTSGQTSFTIKNTGTASDLINLGVTCTNHLSGSCQLSHSSVSLGTDKGTNTAVVTVSFTTGTTVGARGRITVTGTSQNNSSVSASAFTDVDVLAPPPPPPPPYGDPAVNIVNGAGGVERSLCVAVSAGAGAAYECGDLRLAHALPAVLTFGSAKAPTLLYNSQHARPRPVIRANITVPGGTELPTQITAAVTINGAQRGIGSWSGSDWGNPGQTRSVAIEIDANGLGTSLWPYTLSVTAHWPSSVTTATSVENYVPLVNRSDSPFGAGWWVAGLEQLSAAWINHNYSLVLNGGDGTVRFYIHDQSTSNVFRAPPLNQPDSIVVLPSGVIMRDAGNGVRVFFANSGQHDSTMNRLGQVTRFIRNASGQLTSIEVPTNGAGSLVYSLAYNHAGNKLSSVSAPGVGGARVVTIAQSSGRITTLTDPDGHSVSFGYGTGADANLIVSRTDKRSYVTNFTYDEVGRLKTHNIAGLTWGSHQSVERRGLSGGPVPTAQPLDSVFVRVVDGRGGVTTIRVNPYGAPTRVRNALGQETQITYDAIWPALAHQVVSPTGLMTRAYYSPTRGLLDSTVVYGPNGTYGASGNAKTTYQWHASVPLLTQVTPPVGPSSSFGWDVATRNRLWEQVGTDQARRVNYGYNAAGLLQSVTLPLHNAETFTYDALGNLATQLSPAGHTTTFQRDAIGRETLVLNPDGSRTRTRYDAMSRPDTVVTWGPARSVASTVPGDTLHTPADSVIVATTYDANGNARLTRRHFEIVEGYYPPSGPLVISRYLRSPTTESEYDGANRVTRHWPDDIGSERSIYDAAGNVIQQITARNDTLFMQYDALNRLTQRITREKSYGSSWCWVYGMANCNYTFPSLGSGVVIPADTATFAYDADGNMTQAFNGAARIWRKYTPAGQLATDSLHLRTWAMNDISGGWSTGWGAKIYGLRYVYDLGGRRTAMLAPTNLRPSGAAHDSLRYIYSMATGALETVRDQFGRDVTLHYDAAGRNWQRIFPNGLAETRTYDAAGRTLTYQAPGAADDSYQYDAMGRITLATVGQVPITLAYTGLGAVLQTVNATSMYTNGAEQFLTDALGNRGWERNMGVRPAGHPDPNGIRLSTHDGSGRLTRRYWPGTVGYVDDKNYVYDVAGNRVAEWGYETEPFGGGGGGGQSDDAADADASAHANAGASAAGEDAAQLGGLGSSLGANLGFGSGLSQGAGDGLGFFALDGDDPDGDVVASADRTRAISRTLARTRISGWLPIDLGAAVVTAPVISHTVTTFGADLTVRFDQTRHYYGPDNKLRVLNRVVGPTGPAHAGSVYEEYRYDALGRRVVVRSRSLASCGMNPCPQSYIERTVWDGDQVLAEIRGPGGSEISDNGLENDNPSSSSGQSYAWGRVLYVHGPGIDAPLMVLRSGMSDQPDPVTLFPHANWRGEYTNGSHPGSQTTNTMCAGSSGCPAISWPGAALTVDGAQAPGTSSPAAWVGSLLGRKTDGSGLQYMRNRYYDPATGKFTQVDPIGLAGGLNLYGFANGDAINFSDPFGLCPACVVAVAIFEAGATLYDAWDVARTYRRYRRGEVSREGMRATAAGAGAGLFAFGGGYGKATREVIEAGFKGVSNVAEQAAYQELAAGVRTGGGVVIAGGSSKSLFRDAGKYAQEHGGDAADYVKKSTTHSVTTEAGSKVHQIHWVENRRTGAIYDAKLTTTVKE